MHKIIWIIGCPRSGTSFLTDYIGEKTNYCFNEPWVKYPLGKHKNWNLPNDGNIVFKYCANCFYYNEIKEIYPNSKWIHIVRNPLHVLYSMIFPKKESIPERNWNEMGLGTQRIIEAYKKWKTFLNCCFKIKEAKIIHYENIDFNSISCFVGEKLEKPNFINRNYIFDKNKMKSLKKIINEKKLHINKIYY
jgi:hypothetical protein